ncbi:hypothetical protein B0G62_101205 [Paraburkholderia eburnea]|uniref:Uncharacterized protein n=1 Tax=Paraburkholderia eburnea TaxID=1189126 RepID=A0A2S4MM41_9BURK|nr:hypothetical protein B0G62_101205 [Paraburkholderia eburnea]PRZ26937.1 hypothetical protein BX588_101204 [Paraburkholderia eburnea]
MPARGRPVRLSIRTHESHMIPRTRAVAGPVWPPFCPEMRANAHAAGLVMPGARGVPLKTLSGAEETQVFCTTMVGNFELMSRERSAIWIATRRAIAL